MRYPRRETPAYEIQVEGRPRKKGGTYREAVRRAAAARIRERPITTNDVEVEIIYSTTAKEPPDVDNAAKPTLDALKGHAYVDDAQVRSVTVTRFDPRGALAGGKLRVSGRVEHIGRLFVETLPRKGQAPKDATLIWVFSDSRLQELGGEEAVRDQRREEWFREEAALTKRTTRET